MLKHFGGFLVGISVGILIVAVALVGGGYLFLTKEGTMKTVEESIGSSIGMDLNEEQEKLSLLEYGKGVLDVFGKLGETPIKDIESTVGINKISTTISDAIGIDTVVIGESSISNLGKTLTDNLTISIMQEKFEVELPDLPLFQDEEFLARPMTEAFGDLDQNTLDSFIEVVYDEEATPENPASSPLVQKLGKKTIKEVSEDMDAVVQDTTIGEVIEIGKDSSKVLYYLKDTKIGELDGAIKDMKIKDAIEIHKEDDPENGIEKSHAIMVKIAEFTLDDLANKEKLQTAIDDLTLGDVVTIGPDAAKLLVSLKDTSIGGLSSAMDNLTLEQVMDDYNVGVLSLVPADTRVQDMGSALSDAVTETSLYALRQAGLFSYDLSTGYSFTNLVSRIHKNNSTPHEIIGDFTDETATKKSITSSIYLKEGTTAVNTTFLSTIEVLPGYAGQVDATAVTGLVKDANGAYILTPQSIDAICASAGISNAHSVIIYADDGLSFLIQASETDGVFDNYTKTFSILFSGVGSIAFGKGVRMENQVGGCGVYVAPTIKVYNETTDAFEDYVAGTSLPVSLMTVAKTAGSTPEANTWLSAYTSYQS